jgi:hypothetical protein
LTYNTADTIIKLGTSVSLAIGGGTAALGYGFMFGRFLRIRPNLGDVGILGLFCFGILGATIHLATALSTTVEAIVLSIGLLLAGMQWREIAGTASNWWAVAGICVVTLLHAQSLPQSQSDMAGYHLQTLRWYREFSITPGLGNLHGRLAFNSIVTLIAALTDNAGTRWITNVLFAAFFWIAVFSRFQTVQTFQAVQSAEPRRRIEYWFLTLALGTTAVLPRLLGETWALNADIVAAYLIMYWVVLALGYERSDRRTTTALLILSASLAMTAKISAAPLVLFTIVFVVRHFDVWGTYARHASGVAALLLITWMGRGILLSGCALYPVRQTCVFSLPWAESPEMVYDEYIAIRSWARIEGEGHFTKALRDWNWVGPWLQTNWRQPLFVLLLLGGGFGLAALLSHSARKALSGDVGLICVGLTGCLIFWFVSAPDVRFAAGFLFSAAALGISVAGTAWLRNPRLDSIFAAAPITLLTIGGLLSLRTILVRPDYNIFKIPEVAVYRVDMAGGRGVWVPSTGSSCWDHPLPCTPYVNPGAIAKVRTRAVRVYRNAGAVPPLGWTAPSSVNPYPEERHSEDGSK